MDKTKVTKDLENKTLIIERSFEAPKEKLWAYYAEKEKFEQWWGPEGWTTTTKEFNFVPDGRVHYGMKCVDENQGEWFGQESWGLMEIQQVNAPHSFSYRDYFSDEAGNLNNDMPVMLVTNEFIGENGQSKLVCRCLADSAEQIEQLLEMGMAEGFESQLNKLDKLFAEE